jgi:TRAP-type C4-dicarboxylate transport system substrate-binding protein
MINNATFARLSPNARDVLQSAVIELEATNIGHFSTLLEEVTSELITDGVVIIDFPQEAGVRHVYDAHALIWDTLAARIPKQTAIWNPAE